MARQLAPVEDVVFHDEQMLMLLYERMQNAPPLYDVMHRVSLHLVVTDSSGSPKDLLETLEREMLRLHVL